MTTYNDLINLYGDTNQHFINLDQKETNNILAAYLCEKYKHEIIDFLNLCPKAIGIFLRKNKTTKEKIKAYDKMAIHLINSLSDHFGDHVDDDIDKINNEYNNEENLKLNQADGKIKQMKESGCFIRKLMHDAYLVYDHNRKARLKELCHKA